MTTQLEDHGTHWVVKTVSSPGKRKRFGRLPVIIPKGDDKALRAEIEAQATALRASVGVPTTTPRPVV